MPRDASAGTDIGSATRKNEPSGEAPSMAAASNSSFGSEAKKFRSKYIANGKP